MVIEENVMFRGNWRKLNVSWQLEKRYSQEWLLKIKLTKKNFMVSRWLRHILNQPKINDNGNKFFFVNLDLDWVCYASKAKRC